MVELYYHLTLYSQTFREIWSMDGPYSPYLASGLITALDSLLSRSRGYNNERYEILDQNRAGYLNNPIRRGYDPMTVIAGQRHYIEDMEITLITKVFSDDVINNYAVWNINSKGLIDMHDFATEENLKEFLQGVLTMVRAFNTNPRDVLLTYPLHKKEYLQIEGVNLPLLPE